MPHEGYADPITNDGPGFHSDVPIIKLTERVTRAIEASDVSSTPRPCPTLGLALHLVRPFGRAQHLGWRSVSPDPSATPDT